MDFSISVVLHPTRLYPMLRNIGNTGTSEIAVRLIMIMMKKFGWERGEQIKRKFLVGIFRRDEDKIPQKSKELRDVVRKYARVIISYSL